jgi:hypothetical protein
MHCRLRPDADARHCSIGVEGTIAQCGIFIALQAESVTRPYRARRHRAGKRERGQNERCDNDFAHENLRGDACPRCATRF